MEEKEQNADMSAVQSDEPVIQSDSSEKNESVIPKLGNEKAQETEGIIPKLSSEKSTEVEGIIPKINTEKAEKVDGIIPKSNDSFKPIAAFFKKHKKSLIVSGSCMVAAVTALILFFALRDTTVIYWDEKYPDYEIEVLGSANQLELKAIAVKDEEEVKDITYEVSGGTFEIQDGVVLWNVPGEDGEYKITAKTPRGKKVEKTVVIANANTQDDIPYLSETVEKDETTDSDEDGLTDYEEDERGTDAYAADTDKDGLYDYIEIYATNTDPLKEDTDDDGLNDGNEITLGYNPLSSTSLNDGIRDGDRQIEYSFVENDVTVTINGQGNIATTSVEIIDNSVFAEMEGISGKVIDFSTAGNMSSATVTIPYTDEDLAANNIKENELTLYYFDTSAGELKPVEATIDTNAKTITATLSHFSMYLYGNSSMQTMSTDIMFVIDNSVSMYSEQQMIDNGYNSSTGAIGSDTEFKRLDLTKEMTEMFKGNYRFGVAEFSGNYVNLNTFTDSNSDVQNSIESMRNNWNSDTDGTDIIEALESGINEFDASSSNKYLILLTDGENTEGYLSSHTDDIIDSAVEKDVKICIIGLGATVDTDELTEIAEGTGCGYYSASNADTLDEMYSLIGASINYDLVDTDGDGEVDGMIMADSGFITSRDGFNFANRGTVQSEGGVCAGMAEFAMARYTGELSMALSQKTISYKSKKILLDADMTISASGYNLYGTYFTGNGNLYDYTIQDESIAALYYEEKPKDYYGGIDNGVLKINDKYKNALSEKGANIFVQAQHEAARINTESSDFVDNTNNSDAQLFRAIWRLFILQHDDDKTTISAEYDKGYELLIQMLENKIPITVSFGYVNKDNKSIYHEVNAVRWIKDINNSNSYKLEIYDNNHPGEREYISVKRTAVADFIGYLKNSPVGDTENGEWSVIDNVLSNSYYNYTYSYSADETWTEADHLDFSVDIYPVD